MIAIDDTLLYPRHIKRWEPDDEGLGYVCDLDCGHSVWTALEPSIAIHCGLCLQQLITQIREVQAAQRIR